MKNRRPNDEELLQAVRELEWRIAPFGKRGRKITQALRRRVLERDKSKCRRCGSAYDLTVHHIKPRREGGENTFANLTTLCQRCHAAHHLREGIGHDALYRSLTRKAIAPYLKNAQPPEEHP